MRNVGFVKVEQGDEKTVVHVHGKGLRLSGDHCLKLYIFYMEGKECTGVLQGTIENVNPAVNYRLCYTAEDTGNPKNYPLIDGIIMENDSQRKFAAVWNDMPVDLENMKIWAEEEKPPENAEAKEETLDSRPETEEAAEEEEAEEPEEKEGREEKKEAEEVDARYIEPSGIQYTKIQRQDLARLPRCEWRLANNSFLLHGYYNYHHLLFIEEGDKNWIGIPGVYHQREAKAAEAFGFPRFIRVDEDAVGLTGDERNTEDDFGYWCRQVRR